MQALAAGAVSIITKPKCGLKGFLEDPSNDIVAAIRAAAAAPRPHRPLVRPGGGAAPPAKAG
jgi:two-component system chemotaxis response regulator CheB